MIDFLVSPVAFYLYLLIVIIYFRKEGVSIGQVFSFFLRRVALNFDQELTDIFTIPDIVILVCTLILIFVLWNV